MQGEHTIPPTISDIARTINLLVTQTAEGFDQSNLWDGPKAARDLKRRIWTYLTIQAARAKNALLPISCLPEEVFLLCVDSYLEASRTKLEWNMETYRRLHTLSSVCWLWKCTIDHTPALWSVLPGWPGQSDEHAELCLSRSADHPLAIDFYLRADSLREFDQRILPNFGRCSTFSLQLDRQFALLGRGQANRPCVSAFDRFKNAQMPRLECFYLRGHHAVIFNVDIFAVHPESPLKRLDLECWWDLSFATPPPATLKHLSIRCLRFQHGARLDPSQFFSILSQLPVLEHLEICDVSFWSSASTTLDPLPLGNLEHLRLEQHCPFILDFLRRAVLPSLQTFHVGLGTFYVQDRPDLDDLKTFLTPLINEVLRTLSGSSSLRLEVTSGYDSLVKICDDNKSYIDIVFETEDGDSRTLSLQWLNRILRDVSRPLHLYITFRSLGINFFDQSLLDALVHLPHVRSITAEGCSSVAPLVLSLESAQDCPLPELTDLIFDSIKGPIDRDLVQWVQTSRSLAGSPLNISFT